MPRKSCHGHGSTTARPVILCFFLSSGRRHRFVAARAGYKFAKQPRVPHVGVSAAAAFMGQQKEALSAACWQRTLELELELISAAAAQRLMVNSLDSWAFTFASPMPAEAHNVAHTPHITNRRASTDYKSSEQTMRRAPKSHWHHPPTTTPFPDQPPNRKSHVNLPREPGHTRRCNASWLSQWCGHFSWCPPNDPKCW